MARRTPPPRRPNAPAASVSRATPAPRRPMPRPNSAVSASASPLIDPQADVSATYAHVKRDLLRIAVIALFLFAIIVGSRFVL